MNTTPAGQGISPLTPSFPSTSESTRSYSLAWHPPGDAPRWVDRRTKRTKQLHALMLANERTGRRIRLQIICRVRGADLRDTCATLGEMITLSSPTVAGARYIRRRLEELAAELDGMIIVPDDLPADQAARQTKSPAAP